MCEFIHALVYQLRKIDCDAFLLESTNFLSQFNFYVGLFGYINGNIDVTKM